MNPKLDQLHEGATQLRKDLEELESQFSHWDASSTAGGRRLRSIAKRVILSAQRLESLVKENTYAP
jgi:hypothetical protein